MKNIRKPQTQVDEQIGFAETCIRNAERANADGRFEQASVYAQMATAYALIANSIAHEEYNAEALPYSSRLWVAGKEPETSDDVPF